jgi:hypothetical protein
MNSLLLTLLLAARRLLENSTEGAVLPLTERLHSFMLQLSTIAGKVMGSDAGRDTAGTEPGSPQKPAVQILDVLPLFHTSLALAGPTEVGLVQASQPLPSILVTCSSGFALSSSTHICGANAARWWRLKQSSSTGRCVRPVTGADAGWVLPRKPVHRRRRAGEPGQENCREDTEPHASGLCLTGQSPAFSTCSRAKALCFCCVDMLACCKAIPQGNHASFAVQVDNSKIQQYLQQKSPSFLQVRMQQKAEEISAEEISGHRFAFLATVFLGNITGLGLALKQLFMTCSSM